MRSTTALIIVVLALTGLSAGSAIATNDIYHWVDKEGVVHYGDQAPRTGSAEQIKINPAPKQEQQVSPVEQAPAEQATTQDPQAEPEMSFAQKRRAQRAKNRKEAAQKKREGAAECDRAHQLVTRMEPSTRVMVELEDGTVARLDDDKRLEMLKDAKGYISRNCD